MRRRATLVALGAGTLAVLVSLPFFVRPLLPWPDQGMVLHAGVRHARGLGLTTPVPDRRDLTLVHAERMTYFPPLYALAVSAGLRLLGAADAPPDGPAHATRTAVERLVKLTNATALLAGVAGWAALAARVARSRLLLALYGTLSVVAGGASVPVGGTADYLLWAAMPWWSLALLRAERALDAGCTARALRAALGAGLIGAVLVGVRWATLFLVPAVGLFALADALRARPWRSPGARRVALASLVVGVAAAAPVGAAYLALTLWNRSASGGSESVLSYIEPHWDWSTLRTLYPFEALFAMPLGLEPLLTRAWRALEPARESLALGVAFRMVVPGVALVALLRATRHAGAGEPSEDPRRLMRLAAATLVALVLFLAYLSLRYTWSFSAWAYLDEPRYYRPVAPLAALLWLVWLERLPARSRLRVAFTGMLCVGALYLVQAQARGVLGELRRHDERQELVERVRVLEEQPGLHVVLDTDVSEYVLGAGARLLARGWPDPGDAAGLVASRPCELWLVRRLRETTPYVRDRDWDRKRFDAVRARVGAARVWSSSTGAYELWHATLGPPPF